MLELFKKVDKMFPPYRDVFVEKTVNTNSLLICPLGTESPN